MSSTSAVEVSVAVEVIWAHEHVQVHRMNDDEKHVPRRDTNLGNDIGCQPVKVNLSCASSHEDMEQNCQQNGLPHDLDGEAMLVQDKRC